MEFGDSQDLTELRYTDTIASLHEVDVNGRPQGTGPGSSRLERQTRPSDEDTVMDDDYLAPVQPRQKTSGNRRSKRAELDWDSKRQVLYDLYIRDTKVLTETMEIMKKNYGFEAP